MLLFQQAQLARKSFVLTIYFHCSHLDDPTSKASPEEPKENIKPKNKEKKHKTIDKKPTESGNLNIGLIEIGKHSLS